MKLNLNGKASFLLPGEVEEEALKVAVTEVVEL